MRFSLLSMETILDAGAQKMGQMAAAAKPVANRDQ
jgi:hypothetical protein